MLPLRATPLQPHNKGVPRPQNPPSKEDSLANASSGARQEDVSPAKQYPMPRANQNPPHQRHSREGGRERSDRRSKSRQHNLKATYLTGVSTTVKAEIRSNPNPPAPDHVGACGRTHLHTPTTNTNISEHPHPHPPRRRGAARCALFAPYPYALSASPRSIL